MSKGDGLGERSVGLVELAGTDWMVGIGVLGHRQPLKTIKPSNNKSITTFDFDGDFIHLPLLNCCG